LAQNDPVLGLWPELMFQWLRTGGWLTDRRRLAVHGTVNSTANRCRMAA
jgi:hypothetical protein